MAAYEAAQTSTLRNGRAIVLGGGLAGLLAARALADTFELDPALFPVAEWRRCMLHALDRAPSDYGEPAGIQELRASLANWSSRSRGVTASVDELVVTSGTGHALDLIARVLLDPGAVVAVEEPGYPPVVELLRAQGLHVVGVPVDDQGNVVDAIPSKARLV